MEETANTIHGRLLEAVHISGYSFERAYKDLRWLFQEDRWKTVGQGFENIDDFLLTVNFSEFKIAVEKRKEMAKMLADLRATQRATGKMLGVTEATVNRDLKPVTNVTKSETKSSENLLKKIDLVTNVTSPPPVITQSGAEAARAAEKLANKIAKKEENNKKKKDFKELSLPDSNNNKFIVRSGEWWNLGKHKLFCGDSSSEEFRNCISKASLAFADPPYNTNSAEWDSNFIWNHDYLIEISDIVAVTPGISSILDFSKSTKMPYRWSCATWINNGMTRGALGFGNWIYTAIFSNKKSIERKAQDFWQISIRNNETSQTDHKGRKPIEYLAHLIDLFTSKNDFIIDPFLGSGQSLLVAEEMSRICIGAEISEMFCSEIITRWELLSGHEAVKQT